MAKVVLVTGATSGIGAGTAKYLAAEGWRVVLTGRREEEGKKVVDEIRSKGGEATFVKGDIGESKEAVKTIMDQAVAAYGRLDAAFNNAGYTGDQARFEDLSTESFEGLIRVNIMGTFWCIQEQLRRFREQKSGAIVNCSSISGLSAIALAATYSATKHAIIGLTRCAAFEYARTGVTVNAVAPGFVRTAPVQAAFEAGFPEETIVNVHPMQRLGTEEEVAQAVNYLFNSAWTTGTVLEIDGGFGVRYPMDMSPVGL